MQVMGDQRTADNKVIPGRELDEFEELGLLEPSEFQGARMLLSHATPLHACMLLSHARPLHGASPAICRLSGIPGGHAVVLSSSLPPCSGAQALWNAPQT